MKDKLFVVCVDFMSDHIPESTIVNCSKCGRALWCSPWNLDKTPICFFCIENIKEEKKWVINLRDVIRAAREIKLGR